MPEQTPAQRQAGFLTALAEHLRAHPHLPIVNTAYDHGGGWQLHVISDGLAGLIRWARSLGAEQLSAMAMIDAAWSAVKTNTQLGPWRVEVFVRVDDFPRDVTAVTVVELEHFAVHGALPEAGGSDG